MTRTCFSWAMYIWTQRDSPLSSWVTINLETGDRDEFIKEGAMGRVKGEMNSVPKESSEY